MAKEFSESSVDLTLAKPAKGPPPINRKREVLLLTGFSYAILGLNFVSGILLVPVYLQYINYELYGAWLATGNVLAWLTLFDPGLGRVLTQKIAQHYGARELSEAGRTIFPGFVLAGTFALLIAISGQFIAPYIADFVNLDSSLYQGDLESAFRIAVCGVGLSILSFAPSSINVGMLRSLDTGFAGLVGMLVYVITILILIFSGYGLYSLAWALVTRPALGLSVNFACMVRNLRKANVPVPFSMANSWQLVNASIFTFLTRSGTVLCKNFDAFAVTLFIGPAAVVPFTLTRRGLVFATSILQRPSNAMTAAVSHLHGENDPAKMLGVMRRALRLIMCGGVLTAFAFLAMNREFIEIWVGPDLYAGNLINLFFVLSFIAILSRTVWVDLTIALGGFAIIGTISLIESILFLLILLSLGHLFGQEGIAASAFITSISLTAWLYIRAFLRRLGVSAHAFVPLVRTGIVTLSAGILAAGTALLFNSDNLWVFLLEVFCYIAVFCLVSLFFEAHLRKESMDLVRKLFVFRKVKPAGTAKL